MPTRTRAPRTAVPGARLQFANTVAELVNLSPTGALIRMAFELRKGGEWPIALDVPGADHLWLQGRVVRCRRDEGAFLLALSFVAPGAEARKTLDAICSTPSPAQERRLLPLPWHLPAWSFERLLRLRLSPSRQCPECHSTEVFKERRYSYSCSQCGCRFSGFRVGRVRVSL